MKTTALRSIAVLMLAVFLIPACGPADKPDAPPPVSQSTGDVLPVEPLPTSVPTVVPTNLATEEGEPIEHDKNVLVLIEGTARISHDSGDTWGATETGQWLESGDEIQLSDDALALIFFFNGAVMRLEGLSDYQLQLAEFDPDSGATRIISRLWDGYALFETNPLPTPDSKFQFYVMTSFIDVEYDASLADAGRSIDLDPEISIIAGGLLDEETEMLYHFQGPASLYVLDWEDEEFFAEVFPVTSEEVTSLEITFLDDERLEAEIEGFADIAGYLIYQYRQSGELGVDSVLGYTLYEIEEMETGETLFWFENVATGVNIDSGTNPNESFASAVLGGVKARLLVQPDPDAVPGLQPTGAYIRRVKLYTTPRLLAAARNPQVTDTEVKLVYGNKKGAGCNPKSGYGCPVPVGCDQATGEGCTLTTGCNVVTKKGCQKTTVTCVKSGKYDAAGNLIGATYVCPASSQPGCNPNIAGDCDRFYKPDSWKPADQDGDGGDGDISWCTCTAAVPPGWPPPPPGMDMTYRCWCSDPGASK